MGIEAIVAPAVAAAGNVAGGLAANALMGEQKPYTGGGIDGVTTTKSSGKDDKNAGIPQVDASQALEWFKQAAVVQNQGQDEGLQYYLASLDKARGEIQQGFEKSNSTLAPVSYASTQALNEQMRMMGLAPMSPSAKYAEKVGQLGNYADIQKQMSTAETLKDPTARAAAKTQILTAINSQITPDTSAQQIAALGGPKLQEYDNPYDLGSRFRTQALNGTILKAYQDQVAAIQASNASTQAKSQQLAQIAKEYNSSYSDNYDGGYTGQQVTDKITSTPGYAFQLDQGTKAIERQGAAAGMLGSANTQLALQTFGQQQAQNYYNSYMQNLSNITQQGMGATQQIAQNQTQEGTLYGQISQAGGSAQQQSAIAKGNNTAESLYKQGQLYADTAKYNTGLQYGHTENAAQQAAGLAQSAMGAQSGLLNAQTNQQQLQYQIGQNQQAGQAFASSGTKGGWTTGANGWPVYNV